MPGPDQASVRNGGNTQNTGSESERFLSGKEAVSSILEQLLADSSATPRLKSQLESGARALGTITSFETTPAIEKQLVAASSNLGLPADTRITLYEGLYKDPNGSLQREVRAYMRDPRSGAYTAIAVLREGSKKAQVSLTDEGQSSIADSRERKRFGYPTSVTEKFDALPTTLATVRWHHPELPEGKEPVKPPRVYAVIHESHASEEVRNVGGQEMYDDGVKVNRQVGSILEKLKVSEIYADGVDQQIAKSYKETIAVLRDPETRNLMASIEKSVGTGDPEKLTRMIAAMNGRVDPRVIKGLESLRDFRSAEQSYQLEASAKATVARAMAGQLTFLATERKDLIEAALRAAAEGADEASAEAAVGGTPFPKDERGRWKIELREGAETKIFDARETYSLDVFAASGRQFGVAVWGAGHDFRSECRTYNQAHPDRPITLVEITPTEFTANYNLVRLPARPTAAPKN